MPENPDKPNNSLPGKDAFKKAGNRPVDNLSNRINGVSSGPNSQKPAQSSVPGIVGKTSSIGKQVNKAKNVYNKVNNSKIGKAANSKTAQGATKVAENAVADYKGAVLRTAKAFAKKDPNESRRRAISRGMRKAVEEAVIQGAASFGIPPIATKAIGASIVISIMLVIALLGTLITTQVVQTITTRENMNYAAVQALPDGYDEVFAEVSMKYDVPYGLLAGLSKTQTDHSRGIEIDGIDRDPKRKDPTVFAAPANSSAPKQKVSVFPKVTPEIGKKGEAKPGLGTYLLKSAGLSSRVKAQEVKSSTDFIGAQLDAVRDQMISEGWAPIASTSTPEYGDQFWSFAVNRLSVVNRFGDVCSLSDPPPPTPEAIKILWRCEAAKAEALYMVTSVGADGSYAYADYNKFVDQVLDDALYVSFAFSRWGTNPCDPNSNSPQGVFPLDRSIADRCDPIANIKAAAAKVIPGFSAGQPPANQLVDGPYSALIGGWSALPTAIGQKEYRVGQQRPYNTWSYSQSCSSALQNWFFQNLPVISAFGPDFKALDQARKDELNNIINNIPARTSECAAPNVPTMDEWRAFFYKQAKVAANSFVADEIEDQAAPGEEAGLKVTLNNLADSLQVPNKVPQVGIDPLIPRLSPILLTIDREATDSTDFQVNPVDLGKRVIQASLVYGGLVEDDPRVAEAIAGGFDSFKAPADAAALAAALRIDIVVASAYINAASKSNTLKGSCTVGWEVVAGVGYAESRHAAGYLPAYPDGRLAKKVIGIPLNGQNGTAAIRDTDQGQWDGDTVWDRAVGPTQFIPSTWRTLGMDGNDDGVADPFNLFDATMATLNHLCYSSGGNLQTDDLISKGVFGYNKSSSYNNEVMSKIREYRSLNLSTSSPHAPQAGGGKLSNPVPGTPMTSPYGTRIHPIFGTKKLHAGQDYGARTGTPILAAADGKVITAGWVSGYGNYTCLDHGAGLSTCYAHQSTIQVSMGQNVARGSVIGQVGNTGNSTGPHLHFEVRMNNSPVDPKGYL